MQAPFNAPRDPRRGKTPTMDGFVTDYRERIRGGDRPAADLRGVLADHGVLPAGADARLVELAKGFACFDHWFCEVPSQTFTNRSFFHAASASGLVVNLPFEAFPLKNDAETISSASRPRASVRVYIDSEMLVSFRA